ncbi:MAG: nucleoside recognition protein [Firmicutes bacterium]|nr:nucleoside recognition protein [Bacillota bacterium]
MVNYLWVAMICLAIIVAGINGRIDIITASLFKSAENAVAVAILLVSVMTFWLGIMKIVEKSGLIDAVKTFLRPLALFLFPRLPHEHPAMNAILMNMSANLLGMGNAATPFGIKAMEEMQKLNEHPTRASDEMCTFLAINTSSLTILPSTIIALRVANGSANPTEIVGTTIIATFCSVTVALFFDRLLRRRRDRK